MQGKPALPAHTSWLFFSTPFRDCLHLWLPSKGEMLFPIRIQLALSTVGKRENSKPWENAGHTLGSQQTSLDGIDNKEDIPLYLLKSTVTHHPLLSSQGRDFPLHPHVPQARKKNQISLIWLKLALIYKKQNFFSNPVRSKNFPKLSPSALLSIEFQLSWKELIRILSY